MIRIAIALLGALVFRTALVVSVRGDEACDASATAGSSSGEKICATKRGGDGSHDVIPGEDGTIERPTWWDYDIDQLFEDHFDCGNIVYGYSNGDPYDETDDDYVDDLDLDAAEEKHTKMSDAVSETQLERLRLQWEVLREKYVKEVNLVPIFHQVKLDSIAEIIDIDGGGNGGFVHRPRTHGVSAIVVPSQIGDAGPKKGRGLFATAPISKGALVVNLDNGSTGLFKVGHSWREFAVSLPREIACNFIEWSWVQTVSPSSVIDNDDDVRNGLSVFIAFDESNLMNSADWDDVEANVRCGSPPKHEGDDWGSCRFQYHATRDIAAGEELLLNYGDFEETSQQGWVDIGL